MQPMIIIIEYMLEQIIVNFSFNFFASKLCESIPMSLKLSPPNSFRAYYELHLLSEQKWNNGTAEFLQLILPCCNNSLLIFPVQVRLQYSAVEPWSNDVPSDWQNLFTKMWFCYIEVVIQVFYDKFVGFTKDFVI